MGELEPRWSRRHKRRGRRIANELRLFAPLAAVSLCLMSSATVIYAAERGFPVPPETTAKEALAASPSIACRPME